MIISFSGDPFLARRAAKRELAARGFASSEVTEIGEGMTPNDVATLAAQGGLFGQVALLLDFGEAFTGQAGVKARNEMMSTLMTVGEGAFIAVLDQEATAARIKRWRELGQHVESPTPRYEALPRWVTAELDANGLRYDKDVPAALADLFGEDVASLASEITKLTALDEQFTAGRVRQLANRVAVHDAFDLIDRIAKGDASQALRIARQLLAEGEAPQRVLGALVWQFMLVAKALAFSDSQVDAVSGGRSGSAQALAARAATALKVRPFVAQKALALAEALDESSLRDAMSDLLAADVGAKSGSDPEWALESLVIGLAARWSSGERSAA